MIPESQTDHKNTGYSGCMGASPSACGDNTASLWETKIRDFSQLLIPGKHSQGVLCCFFQKPPEILPNN